MNYGSTTGGSVYNQSGGFAMKTFDVNGLADNTKYYVKRVEVRKNITFSYLDETNVWCRGVESVGWTKEEHHGDAKKNYGQGFCETVPGTVTNTSATLRTYIYNVWTYNSLGQPETYLGKFPTNESNVEFAYSLHGIPGTSLPSVTISGPGHISSGSGAQYTANVSGGASPFSYQWKKDGVNVGTSSTYYLSTDPSDDGIVTLSVTVTDDNNNDDTDNHNVFVDPYMKRVVESNPQEYNLSANYPNPFNPSTQITYQLPEQSSVTLEVFDVMGRKVATLVNTNQAPGMYTEHFDASGLSSGLYIARIEAAGNSGEVFSREMKMQLIK